MQLRFHTIHKQFRRIVAVETMQLAVDQILQIFNRVFNLRRKQIMGHRANRFAHIRNQIRVGYNNFVCLILAQIAELLQHLICCTEIQGIRFIRIIEALGCQKNVSEDLILRIQEVNVTGGNNHLS